MTAGITWHFEQGHWYAATLDLGEMGALVTDEEISQLFSHAAHPELAAALRTLTFAKLPERGRWAVQGQWLAPARSVALPAEVLAVHEVQTHCLQPGCQQVPA